MKRVTIHSRSEPVTIHALIKLIIISCIPSLLHAAYRDFPDVLGIMTRLSYLIQNSFLGGTSIFSQCDVYPPGDETIYDSFPEVILTNFQIYNPNSTSLLPCSLSLHVNYLVFKWLSTHNAITTVMVSHYCFFIISSIG